MTITGAGTANVAILNFEACFPDSIVGFVPTDGVSIYYLYNLFIAMQEALLSTAVTNTQPNLNIERIGVLLTVKPPFAEQEEIVKAIERESGNYDTLIVQAERAIELLRERRTALISAAVTGKIDVREFVSEEAVA
jgi:type I restriction enzyme S subunit